LYRRIPLEFYGVENCVELHIPLFNTCAWEAVVTYRLVRRNTKLVFQVLVI
jgi:hypothetical protein